MFRRAPWLTIVLMFILVGLDRRFDASVGNPGHGGSFLQVPIGSLVAFLVAFSIGMVLHTYRHRIPLVPFVAWSLAGLYIAVHNTKAEAWVLPFMASYGALVLASHWPARLAGYDSWVLGSYGLYIWAFPVQQLLVLAGFRTQWSLTLTALPLTYLCGWLSWRYIEAPTMALRRYLPRTERRSEPRHRRSSVSGVGFGKLGEAPPLAEREPAVPTASA
jgi:peptidoglycan/LPS O-acetylase OafA/YrhL